MCVALYSSVSLLSFSPLLFHAGSRQTQSSSVANPFESIEVLPIPRMSWAGAAGLGGGAGIAQVRDSRRHGGRPHNLSNSLNLDFRTAASSRKTVAPRGWRLSPSLREAGTQRLTPKVGKKTFNVRFGHLLRRKRFSRLSNGSIFFPLSCSAFGLEKKFTLPRPALMYRAIRVCPSVRM